MKAILFLDNWLIERTDCVDRQWYKPKYVKQLIEDFHPETLGYGGYLSAFYDENLGKYVMYLAVYPPEADPGTFVLRLETDDPYEWPTPTYDVDAKPAWKGFKDVVITAVPEHSSPCEHGWGSLIYAGGRPRLCRSAITSGHLP